MKHKLYVFSSFPEKSPLYRLDPDLFVVTSSLKKDINLLKQAVLQNPPKFLIGIAKGRRTQIEIKAVNRFHGSKQVIHHAPQEYPLYSPTNMQYKKSPSPSTTFCNYVSFNLAHFLDQNLPQTHHVFMHLNPKDLSEAIQFIRALPTQV